MEGAVSGSVAITAAAVGNTVSILIACKLIFFVCYR